jgi:hypothetical protein
VPKASTISDIIGHAEFTQYKTRKLETLALYHANVLQEDLHQRMQISAILFETMQLMEKLLDYPSEFRPQMDNTSLRRIRNALIHCKGLLSEIQTAEERAALVQECVTFSRHLHRAMTENNLAPLAQSSLYQRIAEHGQALEEKTQNVSSLERVQYTLSASIQLLLYSSYTAGNHLEKLPAGMQDSAIRYTNIKASIYGLKENPLTNHEAAVSDRHVAAKFNFN